MQRSLEQRMTIKFYVKLEKSPAETIPMLKKAFGVDCLSDRQIFRCTRPSQKVGKMSTMRTALDGHQPPVPTTIIESRVTHGLDGALSRCHLRSGKTPDNTNLTKINRKESSGQRTIN
ncbi:hypothetical protein NQ318_011297 [Aromia moschata]|uniref:Mos1 transposase HTH domain-containing protein n=1 Tax=Aromia moschata TaxID=1265417 RepID=A0AAV8XTA7_9CUCU|nr:hypothetical protein NQ318_011297 [Aromia moschata]